MQEMYIVSFNSTHHAIKSDKLFEKLNLKVTTFPTPREITASCGISIRFDVNERNNIVELLNSNHIEYKGIYRVAKQNDGKRIVEKID
jgi:hypothetical protein